MVFLNQLWNLGSFLFDKAIQFVSECICSVCLAAIRYLVSSTPSLTFAYIDFTCSLEA